MLHTTIVVKRSVELFIVQGGGKSHCGYGRYHYMQEGQLVKSNDEELTVAGVTKNAGCTR